MRASIFRRATGGLVIAVGVSVAMLAGSVAAQDVPSTNTGPEFGSFGPGQAAPQGAQAVQPPTAAPGALGAPAPGVPSPSWGGCNQNIAGSWASSGQENVPTFFTYDGNVTVSQWGPWLSATETQGWAQTQYYGRCNGNSVRFDVYSNGSFIGYQYGSIHEGGRFGWPRLDFHWATWAPNYAAGVEHWRRAFN
jgi:hypothetical protein